jgi:hypothetical protein
MKTLVHDECRWDHRIPKSRTDEGWKVQPFLGVTCGDTVVWCM